GDAGDLAGDLGVALAGVEEGQAALLARLARERAADHEPGVERDLAGSHGLVTGALDERRGAVLADLHQRRASWHAAADAADPGVDDDELLADHPHLQGRPRRAAGVLGRLAGPGASGRRHDLE